MCSMGGVKVIRVPYHGTQCSPKNKVAKLADNTPHPRHSCDSFIRAIRDPLCQFYHEWANDTNFNRLFSGNLLIPYKLAASAS